MIVENNEKFIELRMLVNELFVEAKYIYNINWNVQYLTNLFSDVFCDTLLSYIYGLPYYLAVSRLLFLKDDKINDIYEPRYRIWWIRMKVISNIIQKYGTKLINKEYIEEDSFINFVESIINALEMNHKNIINYTQNKRKGVMFCYYEKVASEIYTQLMQDYIKNNEKQIDNFTKDIKNETVIKINIQD